MNTNDRIILGIDPDIDKSGFAVLNLETKKVDIHALTFPQLLDTLKSFKLTYADITVLVEAGWLNSSNWHLTKFDSKQLAASKGNAVGRNHEVGRKIIEMCNHYGLQVQEVKPLNKCWNSNDGKITHEEIAQFIPNFPNRSNQEMRDAALIAWNHAGLPIRLKMGVNSLKTAQKLPKTSKKRLKQ